MNIVTTVPVSRINNMPPLLDVSVRYYTNISNDFSIMYDYDIYAICGNDMDIILRYDRCLNRWEKVKSPSCVVYSNKYYAEIIINNKNNNDTSSSVFCDNSNRERADSEKKTEKGRQVSNEDKFEDNPIGEIKSLNATANEKESEVSLTAIRSSTGESIVSRERSELVLNCYVIYKFRLYRIRKIIPYIMDGNTHYKYDIGITHFLEQYQLSQPTKLRLSIYKQLSKIYYAIIKKSN